MESGTRNPIRLCRAIVLTLRKAAPTREKEAFLRKMAKDQHAWAAASWVSVAWGRRGVALRA